MQRRLAAILAADVVGYTRLMGDDEAGTFRRLTGLRKDILEPLIARHKGRLFKLMGDGLMVEFASLIDAVDCAVAWHGEVAGNEAGEPEERRLCFRIGINLGEVIADGDDIHGDGVNLAARLEALAEPGTIYLSGEAYRQVRGKTAADFQDLGEHELKNVAEPVRVYRVASGDQPLDTARPDSEPPPLPDMPSIAVLPFSNTSGDLEQEHIADGISEDIITTLSKYSGFFIVARNSSFTYKGMAVDVRQVGTEQGVRYVLEGSVRRSGERLRITAQLVDAVTGRQLWAERYDRCVGDVFALQDEITREVASAVLGKLVTGADIWTSGSGPGNFEAWELVVKAQQLMDSGGRQNMKTARELLQKAVRLDSDYAGAWSKLGWAHRLEAQFRWSASPDESRKKAWAAAERVKQLTPESNSAYSLIAILSLDARDYEAAEDFTNQALACAGSGPYVYANAAQVLSFCGRPSDAVRLIERAMRLCPIYPKYFRLTLGRACLLTGDLDRAITTLRQWYALAPEPEELALRGLVLLATALYDNGQPEEAENVLSEAVKARPGFTISSWAKKQTFANADDLAHMVAVLEEFGVPK